MGYQLRVDEDTEIASTKPNGAAFALTLDRREFLLTSSACLLALTSAANVARGAASPRAPVVGFWDVAGQAGDGSAKGGIPGFRPDVLPADRIGGPDRSLIGTGAIVTAQGVVGELNGASAQLNAHYFVTREGETQTVTHHAWSVNRNHVGRSVRFGMPVDAERGIVLSVVNGGSDDGAPEEIIVQLGMGAPGAPALRAGVFLIALSGVRAVVAPRWRDYQFRGESSDARVGERRLVRRGGAQGVEEVQFPYLVVSIARRAAAA